MLALNLAKRLSRGLSVGMGAFGIVSLCASFNVPVFGMQAIICIGMATGLLWATDG